MLRSFVALCYKYMAEVDNKGVDETSYHEKPFDDCNFLLLREDEDDGNDDGNVCSGIVHFISS